MSTLAIPVVPQAARPSRLLPILLFAAFASLIALFQGIQNILIPAVVQQLAPGSKVSTLAILSTLSAVTTVAALLAGGALSDRTRSRFGKRTPWLVLSSIVTIVLMLLLGAASSVVQLMVVMPLMWFSANFYQTVVVAIMPDRIPDEQRGFASAAIALGVPVGIFVGVNVAAFAPTTFIGYAILAVPHALATLALVVFGREPSSLHDAAREAGASPIVRTGFFSAFASADFTLTFISRFVLFLSYFTVSGYTFYVLQDYVGVANLPGGNVAGSISIILSIVTVAWLVVAPLTGILSDRIGHTPTIVGYTSVAIGAVLAIPALSHTWIAMILYAIGLGLTFGIYFAVDLKLASLVLPSAEAAGRDIGLMGVAASGPTVLAPAIAAAIIQYGSFPGLFAAGAVLALLGGIAAFRVKLGRA
uniref:MFS transporter n=1 Tax=uncultured Sphingomonas sp. TaxID=158754 RepID=UPI0035CB9A15